ncbi:MAG: Mu-like prophage major head subunit gpT family protein [Planctomyces sp.]|nr:Mu-like prophage major head subunit gpT family protein [Planctomyces sp.]
MPNASTKKLSSVAIIGMILSFLNAPTRTPWCEKIAHMNLDAQDDVLEYAIASATPQMRRWIGGRESKKLFAQSIEVRSEPFEATVFDLVKNWVYDKTGLLRSRVARFTARSQTHWDKLASEAIELGEATQTYDGANFFSATHSTGKSGTIKNLVVAADVPALNVTTPNAPTAAEAVDIIYGLFTHFKTFKDDAGEPIYEDLMSIIVMVPVKMGAAFQQAVSATILATGGSTKDNPLLRSDYQVEVIVNPRLTSDTVIYAFTKENDPALICQQQGKVELSNKAEGSDYEHDTGQWEFGMKADRSVGLFCWQAALKATLS